MKKRNVHKYPQGSAAYVSAHAAWQRGRGRNPSEPYRGERDPRKALLLALNDLRELLQPGLMNLPRLHRILEECTVAEESLDKQQPPDHVQEADVHFFTVYVDKEKASARRDELIEVLANWPEASEGHPIPSLEEGPSYIHVGAVVGSQHAALVLFGLGATLGLWKVYTPKTLGLPAEFAGRGLVMIGDYDPTVSPPSAPRPFYRFSIPSGQGFHV